MLALRFQVCSEPGVFRFIPERVCSVHGHLHQSAALDIVGNTLKYILLTKFGRRYPGSALYTCAGLCLLLTLAFPRGMCAHACADVSYLPTSVVICNQYISLFMNLNNSKRSLSL